MKKERIEALIDYFTDANGNTRYVTLVALSEPLGHSVMYEYDDDGVITVNTVVKGVKLGFAVCSPDDNFDENLGITIATGRARKNSKYALLTTKLGYVNSPLIEALLKQEAKYFKENPEKYIAGYERMVERASHE